MARKLLTPQTLASLSSPPALSAEGETYFDNVLGLPGFFDGSNWRYSPASTTGGPPSGGSWPAGAAAMDSKYGLTWICTTAGTPGKWTAAGSGLVVARAYLANPYNMPYGVDGTVIPVDTADYDPLGMFTLGTGAKITLPIAGLYFFEGKWETGGMTSGSRGFINFTGSSGTMNRHAMSDKSGVAAGYFGFEGAAVVYCAAGSTMQLTAYQSAANPSLAIVAGTNNTWFSATLLSASTQF